MTFKDLPKDKAFRLSGKDHTVFKIDPTTHSIRIWFRDLRVFVAMPQHMIGGFMKRAESRDYILINKLPTL